MLAFKNLFWYIWTVKIDDCFGGIGGRSGIGRVGRGAQCRKNIDKMRFRSAVEEDAFPPMVHPSPLAWKLKKRTFTDKNMSKLEIFINFLFLFIEYDRNPFKRITAATSREVRILKAFPQFPTVELLNSCLLIYNIIQPSTSFPWKDEFDKNLFLCNLYFVI